MVSGVLAALILQFGYLLEDYGVHQPPVDWYKGASKSMGEQIGKTDCGYRRSADTKVPFCRIKIHSCLKWHPSSLSETYVHELAHHVDWVSDEDWDNHGGQWKRIMRRWGLFAPTASGGSIPSSCRRA